MMLTAIPCLGVPPVLRAQLATVGANMPQLEQLQAQVDADFLTSPPPSSSTTGSRKRGFTTGAPPHRPRTTHPEKEIAVASSAVAFASSAVAFAFAT